MASVLSLLRSTGRIPLNVVSNDVTYLGPNSIHFAHEKQIYSTSKGWSEEKNGFQRENIELPPEPQDCCMSGCANCVWIKYAEEVAKIIGDGGELAKAKIIKSVKDPNLRAFLMMELSHLFQKKDKN